MHKPFYIAFISRNGRWRGMTHHPPVIRRPGEKRLNHFLADVLIDQDATCELRRILDFIIGF